MKHNSFPFAPRQTRNVTLYGARTCIGLEPEMWRALEDVACREQLTLPRLIERIDAFRLKSGDDVPPARLTPAIRVFLLSYYRDIAEGQRPSLRPVSPWSQTSRAMDK